MDFEIEPPLSNEECLQSEIMESAYRLADIGERELTLARCDEMIVLMDRMRARIWTFRLLVSESARAS